MSQAYERNPLLVAILLLQKLRKSISSKPLPNLALMISFKCRLEMELLEMIFSFPIIILNSIKSKVFKFNTIKFRLNLIITKCLETPKFCRLDPTFKLLLIEFH